MLTLYQMQDSGNCYKVRLLLKQLQRPYNIVEVDILKQESRTEEFLEKNPNGRVPTLQLEDGSYLPESDAILWYLAHQTDYLPGARLDQAQVLRWMFFEQYSHEPFIATSRFWIHILKAADQYERQLEERRTGGYAALEVMEKHLGKNDFFVANQYSIADIALYAYSHVADEGGFDLTPYHHMARWFSRIESQANYVAMI